MSISIIDYSGDFFYIEALNLSTAVIIICEEHCLVPSSIGAILIEDPKNFVIASGTFVIRLPSNFHRGIVIGLIYSKYDNTKIFTPRAEIYSKVIPQRSIELADLSIVKSKPSSPQKPRTKDFEDVYNESLIKISKNILLQRPTRALKYASLASQTENFVQGVLVSYAKKNPLKEIDSAKNIASIILEDLENEEVFVNIQGRVEYNENLIQDFFGNIKQKIFVPSYVKSSKPAEPKIEAKPQFSNFRQQEPVYIREEPGFRVQNQNVKPQEPYMRVVGPGYRPPEAPYKVQASAFRPPEAGYRGSEPVYRQAPEFRGPELGYRPQEPGHVVQDQVRFKMEQNRMSSDAKFPIYGVPQPENKEKADFVPLKNSILSESILKINPQVNQLTPTFVSVQEVKPSPILNAPAPKVATFEQNIKPKVWERTEKGDKIEKNKISMTSKDWENCDHFVIDKLTERVSESINEFKSVVHLYRACNQELRNFIEENNFSADDAHLQLHLKKYLKFLIELYFICNSDKDVNQIAENYNEYLSIALLIR